MADWRFAGMGVNINKGQHSSDDRQVADDHGKCRLL